MFAAAGPGYCRSGDWFYQFSEFVALVLTSGALLLTVKSRSADDKRMDSFGGSKLIPADLAVLWIIVPALLLAIVRLNCTCEHNWSWVRHGVLRVHRGGGVCATVVGVVFLATYIGSRRTPAV